MIDKQAEPTYAQLRTCRRDFIRVACAASLGTTLPAISQRQKAGAAAILGQSASRDDAFTSFVDVSRSARLTSPIIYGDPAHVKYIIESMGGGCAFFDYDNDGWIDIFIAGGTRLEGPPAGAGNRLYRNNRNGTFSDVTLQAGLHGVGWACGVCIGDYDNDGYEDLFCTYYGKNRLYHNNGNGTFTDVTAQAGLLDETVRFGTGCSFVDYNRDGLLDLFVANYVEFDLRHPPESSLANPTCTFEGMEVYCGPRGLAPGHHSLYRNNGDGTFTDVSIAAGIAAHHQSYGLTVVTSDVDEDGWPDIFVACDSTPSLLFMNNRDGTFREEGFERGVAVSGEGAEQAGMGVAVGDPFLKNSTSFFITHFQKEASGLYVNAGKGDFTDVTSASKLGGETRFVGWGAVFGDFDNDGLPDIFSVNGNVYPEVEKRYPQYPLRGPRLLFRNLGDGSFQQLHGEAGPALETNWASRGCAMGDFDNDGDLDIVVVNLNDPPSLLRNDVDHSRHWLKVRLIGTKSNRSAIGARVSVRYGGRRQSQELLSQSSYLSCSDGRLHFGLGAVLRAEVEIFWPSGLHESLGEITVDRLITVREAAGIVKNLAEVGSFKLSR